MNRAVGAIVTAAVLLSAGAAFGQPGVPAPPEPATLRGDSTQTRKRLAEAEQKIAAGKAADAADDLQRALDEVPDDLITLNGREYRSTRWVAHGLLAKLPPDALKTYQDRIEQPARKLYEQGKQARDPRPLWQLLDRYFVSRPAEPALLLLGELLFERGDFRTAETVWRRLLPDAGADVAYPGAKADAALVRARIALAVVFQNEPARAKVEVEAFKAKHANATGALGGKTGPLLATLEAYAAAPPRLPPDATSGTAWATFGGGPDRAGRVAAGIPTAIPLRPTWVANEDANGNPLAAPGLLKPPGRHPLGHPVVANGEVFVTDGATVHAFDLQTGAARRPFRPRIPIDMPPGGRVPDPVCALTASGGLLYARLGVSAVRAPETVNGRLLRESALVCLGPQLTEYWRLYPPEDDKTPATWEGAPLVVERRLWAVYARYESGRAVHVAACYDPADATRPELGPDRPVWTAELCESPPAAADRNRQELLTLAGRNLVFCSNSGAVVAVDALSGRRAWGFRYPRAKKTPPGQSGDPSPAVAFGGRVFVAPADGERVYALDAETGRLVWESGPTEGARVLGVSRGRLVIAVAGPLRGVRGLALDSGSYRAADGGWEQSGAHVPLTYGQGLVTDDVIVWPSRDGLYFLDPRTGRPASGHAPNPLSGATGDRYFGNVAYADGVLVVVTPTQVRGYVAQSRKIEVLPDLPPRGRLEAMIDRAEAAVAGGDPPRARTMLAEVAASDLPPALRAWAAARMVQLSPPATELARLPAEVRAALRAPLLAEWVLPPDGVPVTLDGFVKRQLGVSPAPGSAAMPVAAASPAPPDLAADADVDREVRFAPAVSPLVPIPGGCGPKHVFAGGAKVVVAVPLGRAAPREYAAADLFTHAGEAREWFVAAGPRAVAVYGAVREPLWVFRMPADPLPAGAPPFQLRCGCERTPPDLSSFVLVGPWLLARVGERHLIALDLPARRVAWVLSADGRPGYAAEHFPGAVRFGTHVAAAGKHVVVQVSDGRRWFVRLDTGRPALLPALGDRTALPDWPHAPPVCDDAALVSDGPGLVRRLDLGGRVKWAFEADRDDGLTGAPPDTRILADGVFVALRRNHGVEIERVGWADGKRVWTAPAFADADRVHLAHADADAERVYVPAANRLLALALSDGKPAWEADLPQTGGGWVVRAGKSVVVAYPAEAIPHEPPLSVWERAVRSFRREPLVWRLPGLAATVYDAWVTRAVPVLLFDPETGKRLNRIDVPARGPAVAAYLDADRAAIATGDRVVWLK
jgi:outer membrane protein assembly factor BamB